MWMELFAVLASTIVGLVGFLDSVWNKIELLKNLWTFFLEFPQWLNYYNHLEDSMEELKRKMEALSCKKNDVQIETESLERKTGKMRRKEVESWMKNVESKRIEVQRIEKNFRATSFLCRAWWGSRVEKSIKEVKDLAEQGTFTESLVLASSQTKGEVLLTDTLVDGGTQSRTIEEILGHAMSDEVSSIGVHGRKGIGKSSIIAHVHNKLVHSSHFDNVYWVAAPPELIILELQKSIAEAVGLDFSNETDERKRAARLHQALIARKKTVLFLDGLPRHFELDKVGIPSRVSGFKLILTTRSGEVCRRMGCGKTVEVRPLAPEEAEWLFMENVGLHEPCDPEIQHFAKSIVEECGGLPCSIMETANQLRDSDNVHEWRNMVNELKELRNRPIC